MARAREVKPDETVRSTSERNRLVEENIKLVGYVLHLYRVLVRHSGVDQDDAFQGAVLGLIRAAEVWEESRQKFSTLAVICIRNALFQVLARGTVIKVTSFFKGTMNPKYQEKARKALRLLTLDGFDESRTHNGEIKACDDRDEVEFVLSQLECKLREVVHGRYLDGKCVEELAEELAVTKECLRLRLRTAERLIRRRLEAQGYERQ